MNDSEFRAAMSELSSRMVARSAFDALGQELAAARADLYVVLSAITGLPADHLHVRNGCIVAEAGGCTCYGGSPYGHEPGCGYEPIVQLTELTPERRNAREDAVAEASYRTGQLDAQEAQP